MTDSTTPQDAAAMSPASDGSAAESPLGDPEIAVEILKLRVAELEQAIRRLADQDATLSVCEGNVTVEMDATPETLEQLSQRGGPLVPFDTPPRFREDRYQQVYPGLIVIAILCICMFSFSVGMLVGQSQILCSIKSEKGNE